MLACLNHSRVEISQTWGNSIIRTKTWIKDFIPTVAIEKQFFEFSYIP